jgi:hypothetical protein
MTAVLDAHRRYQLVVGLPLSAYRGVGQRVEREDIVMRLTSSRRTWAPIPYKAKVVLPLSGLRQGRGVQRRRTSRNVVHDPVMEAARDGRIIIYNRKGIASGWVGSEPSGATRPGERRWDVATGCAAGRAARGIEGLSVRNRAVRREIRAGECEDWRIARGCQGNVPGGGEVQRQRDGADRHDDQGEHDPAYVLPDAMMPHTLMPHTTILSLVVLSKSLDSPTSPTTSAYVVGARYTAHFLWSQGTVPREWLFPLLILLSLLPPREVIVHTIIVDDPPPCWQGCYTWRAPWLNLSV